VTGAASGATPDAGRDPVWTAVDDYLEALQPADEALAAAQADADAAGLPPIQVTPVQGRMLNFLTRVAGANRALEVGTLAGVSTIWIARGLTGPGAHMTTLEIDPHHAAVARANLSRAGLEGVVEVRVGPAAHSLAALVTAGVEPFDIVFIDADKPSGPAYLQAALQLSHPGTVIVVDNVVRRGGLVDRTSTEERNRGARAVIEAAAADARLSSTVVQTVGRKGHDGFLLVRVDR
jgi:predicted O-methyltransferase YrrM